MKNYTLLNAVTSATDGPAYVMKWERGQIFSLAVSGEFVATVKIYGYAGNAWFPVPLIDLANSSKVTEITETGYYAVLIPKLYSRIKASVKSYTSGAVTVVGTPAEGTLGVFAASLGATTAQTKKAVELADAIQMPTEYVNDLIFAGTFYSKDNTILVYDTVELTDAEIYDLSVNGNPVEKTFTASQGQQSQNIYLMANIMGSPSVVELHLSVVIYNGDLTAVDRLLYIGLVDMGSLRYISAFFKYSTSTLTLTMANVGA